MKKLALLVALLAFSPVARAQDAGHWETRIVTETGPGHWETRPKQVWQEAWVEVEARKRADGSVEHVKIEHPGYWKSVDERVWIEGARRRVEKKVWVTESSNDYVKPWDDTPRSTPQGRTERPTVETPSVRTPAPAPAPAPPAAPAPRSLPSPVEKVDRDPFLPIDETHQVVPAPTPRCEPKVERDPLMPETPSVGQAPAPCPQPERVVVVQQPEAVERVVVVREPAPCPPPRVVYVGRPYVERPCASVYVNDCYPRHRFYVRDCEPRRVYVHDDCGPRVRVGVGVGVRVAPHVRVGFGVRF